MGVKCEIWVIDSLFSLLTIPLTPISRGMNCTGWPVSLISWMSDEYLSVLSYRASERKALTPNKRDRVVSSESVLFR